MPDLVTLLAALPSVTAALASGSGSSSSSSSSSSLHGVRALTSACVDRISAGVAELDLPALAALMAAVSGSSSSSSSSSSSTASGGDAAAGEEGGTGGGVMAALAQAGSGKGDGAVAAFAGAVLAASEVKMGGAGLPTLARLAAAVAQVRSLVCSLGAEHWPAPGACGWSSFWLLSACLLAF